MYIEEYKRLRQNGNKYCNKVTATDEQISLWNEHWINCKCLVDLLGHDRLYIIGNPNQTVVDIIENGVLNPQLTSATRKLSSLIQQIKIDKITVIIMNGVMVVHSNYIQLGIQSRIKDKNTNGLQLSSILK